MVLLTTTPRILEAITLLPSSHDLDPSSLPKSTSDPISHTTLITIARLLRTSSRSTYTLSSLLVSTAPYKPPPPARLPKTPSYEALRAKLLAEQEARTYNSLLPPDLHASHLPDGSSSSMDIGSEEDDISPSLVFNIFLSVVLCGFAVWHVSRFISNDGLRVLMSMGAAIIVGVAEVVVYAAYIRKTHDANKKERRKKEKKTLLRTISATTDKIDDEEKEEEMGKTNHKTSKTGSSTEQQEELIWGKGPNGGLRRRVREKWEREQEKEKEKAEQKQ